MLIDEMVEKFSSGSLEIDCKSIRLRQCGKGSEKYFEGSGRIKQTEDGEICFEIDVGQNTNISMGSYFEKEMSIPSGCLLPDEMFYDLEAVDLNERVWKAYRILPRTRWDGLLSTVQVQGELRGASVEVSAESDRNSFRLYYFDDFDLPLFNNVAPGADGVKSYDLEEVALDAYEGDLSIQFQKWANFTVAEFSSDLEFPEYFHMRVQEALQFMVGKSIFWRVKVTKGEGGVFVDFASLITKVKDAKLSPPIASVNIIAFRDCGWSLFARFLNYLIKTASTTYWSPIAYHLYNARESSALSFDARAVGLSVAVEAISSLVEESEDEVNSKRLSDFRQVVNEFMATLEDFSDVVVRMNGLMDRMGEKRPQDILHALAEEGYVKKSYIRSWTKLRNRHVHPKISDLKAPDEKYYRKLLSEIFRSETLLYQMIFHLIGYKGDFTDYGVMGQGVASYPLSLPNS